MKNKKKAISPIIATVLLVVVIVILTVLILSFGKGFTNDSLDKTNNIKELSSSDAEHFVYSKNFSDGVIQFNYNPPTTVAMEDIVITRYKIFTDNNETAEVPITPEYTLKTGLNILDLTNFSDLNITENKVSIQLKTSNNQYILLKNITNFSSIGDIVPEMDPLLVSIISPEDSNLFLIGEVIDFNSLITGGNEEYSCSWDSNIYGNFETDCNTSFSDLNVGTHLITLTVEASDTNTDTINLTIKDHLVPVIESPIDFIYTFEDNINFVGTTDNNQGAYSCSWDSNIYGNFGTDCDVDIADLNVGEHLITLSITDDLETITSTINITIEAPVELEIYSQNGRLYLTSDFLTANSDKNLVSYKLVGYGSSFVPIEMINPINGSETLTSIILKSCYQWEEWSETCTPYLDLGIIESNGSTFAVELKYSDTSIVTISNINSNNFLGPENCLSGYIPVPGNYLYGTMNDNNGFCVMKYEAKYSSGSGHDTVSPTCTDGTEDYSAVSTIVQSTYSNSPLTEVNLCAAKQICENSGGSLITNNEWMTIARNIERVQNNWRTSIGDILYVGHTDNDPPFALPAVEDDENGYYETGALGTTQRRTLYLNNNEVIWDFSGNILEWTSNTVAIRNHPDAYNSNGTVNNGGWTGGWIEYYTNNTNRKLIYTNLGTTTFIYKDLYLLNPLYNDTKGVGTGRFCSDRSSTNELITGYLRGGSFGYITNAGVLSLSLGSVPSDRLSNFGFRCVIIPE
ncbi:MAG: archaellin/type IV pilin N-terminal domain-containing protein [archaeon]|jgi:flagellin-like protein